MLAAMASSRLQWVNSRMQRLNDRGPSHLKAQTLCPAVDHNHCVYRDLLLMTDQVPQTAASAQCDSEATLAGGNAVVIIFERWQQTRQRRARDSLATSRSGSSPATAGMGQLQAHCPTANSLGAGSSHWASGRQQMAPACACPAPCAAPAGQESPTH